MTDSTGAARPLSVLVVADEAVSGHFLARMLAAAGFAPRVAAGVAEGLDALEAGGIDLVVAGALSLDAALSSAIAAAGRPLVVVEAAGAYNSVALPKETASVLHLAPPLDAESFLAAVRLAGGMPPEVAEVARHLERFRERREFLGRLTASFLDECPGRREALARAVASGSCPLAAREAHGLVSTALAMGSERLAALARKIEVAAREERSEELAAMLPELDAALGRVEAYVRSVLPGGNGQSRPVESNS